MNQPHEEDHKLCAELFDQLTEWLSSGKVEPSQAKSKGGLEQVAEGFQEHRDGVIAGYKLVYSVG